MNKELLRCTKDKPWNSSMTEPTMHEDAKWTETRLDYWDEYKCPHCGLVFQVEVGD